MKIILLLFFLTSLQSTVSQNYQLVWSDEFNTPGKPDPEKWSYETGFIRNLEEQIYTKRKKNVRIKNGKLELVARKEDFKNEYFDPEIQNYRFNTASANYTSGSIHTRGKFEFKYGRIDVRAKLPKGNGIWPAIWMLGANFEEIEYPLAGEIDIMEHVGKEPGKIHGTLHFPWPNKQGIKSNGGTITVENPSENYHIYSLIWDKDKIEFLVNNESYHSFKIEKAREDRNPFRKPFYIILNLALGGNWAGEIDPEIFPQKFLIDYVRVYKRLE